ncbi:hypothetical protein UY3_08789 [Chelonia mydas]|uniref:Uncharacterized protein n=1 Tax=Chelonia mydas TaxID=8469 RepID=M7BPW1_CHEMY|nr:hypothetical protein UY3_08789 [Chelonia mydas]
MAMQPLSALAKPSKMLQVSGPFHVSSGPGFYHAIAVDFQGPEAKSIEANENISIDFSGLWIRPKVLLRKGVWPKALAAASDTGSAQYFQKKCDTGNRAKNGPKPRQSFEYILVIDNRPNASLGKSMKFYQARLWPALRKLCANFAADRIPA